MAGHSIIPQVRYPGSFPMAELVSVSEFIRGLDHAPDAACAIECAWNVVGFGLSLIPHDHPPLIGDSGFAALSGVELADKLAEFTMPRAGLDDIPWNILVPAAIEAFNRILNHLLKS